MADQREEKKSFWDKLGSIDYRIVYTVFIVLLIIPVINPLNIPMKISPTTKAYYDNLMDPNFLPDGSVILVEQWVDPEVWDETSPIVKVTWKILWNIPKDRNITIITYTLSSDTADKMSELFQGELKPPQWRIDTYGETWVDFGYNPPPAWDLCYMTENFGYRLAKDRHEYPIGQEYYGRYIMDIPVIQRVASRAPPTYVINAYDIDLFTWGSSVCSYLDSYIRMWWTGGSPAYHVPMLLMTIEKCTPNILPYYSNWIRPIRGFIAGIEGAAELELLSGFKGDALRRTDLKALGGVGILVLLIPGILENIVYFGKKLLKRAEAGGGI